MSGGGRGGFEGVIVDSKFDFHGKFWINLG